jgi:predicted nucleic acid-binding protein
MQCLLEEDPEIIAWWCTDTECGSAVARLERVEALSLKAVTEALHRLDALREAWYEVQPVPEIRSIARRLLRAHDLRAADALQLAAAVAGSDHDIDTFPFVCLDERLCVAAAREGFVVLPA